MTALEVTELVAGYKGIPAVRGVDLSVAAGEVVALLGANGAGKTTTLLAIAGELPVMGGTVLFGGTPFTGPLHKRAQAGLGFVTETRSIFRQLTVEENLALGRGDASRAYELAPELRGMRDRKAGLLSGGEQQILTLARALAGQPKLLLADELSLGLAPLVAQRMLDVARAAADEGVAVLLVEQHAARALTVADRAYVLQRGAVSLSGTRAELAARLPEVMAAYSLGSVEHEAG
jgi:branched-chain amino acid transport system ATP-binding protein